MNFTAEQVREMAVNVRDCAWDAETKEYMVLIEPMLTAYADAIDAHLAGMGEPVAWSLVFSERVGVNANTTFSTEKRANDYADKCAVPDACDPNPTRPRVVALYTALPIDLTAVRDVIAELRDYGDYADRIKLGEATDKLEAAIKRAARNGRG